MGSRAGFRVNPKLTLTYPDPGPKELRLRVPGTLNPKLTLLWELGLGVPNLKADPRSDLASKVWTRQQKNQNQHREEQLELCGLAAVHTEECASQGEMFG